MLADLEATLKRGDNQHSPIGETSQAEAADRWGAERSRARPREGGKARPEHMNRPLRYRSVP